MLTWRLRRELPAILLVVLLFAVLIVTVLMATAQMEEPPRPVVAQVIRFGTEHNYTGNKPLVIVRIPDGTEKQLPAQPSTLAGCRTGDSINLVWRGDLLSVGPEGCRIASAGAR